MLQRRPCFHGGTVSPKRKSSLLDLKQRNDDIYHGPPRFFSKLVTPQMRDGRGVAQHHALLSGGPALWRQSPQEQAHHVTTTCDHHTWSHSVLVSFLCSIMIQTNIVILMGFFIFFWRFRFFVNWFKKIFSLFYTVKKNRNFVSFDYLRCVALILILLMTYWVCDLWLDPFLFLKYHALKNKVLLHNVDAHNINVIGHVCYLTFLHTT